MARRDPPFLSIPCLVLVTDRTLCGEAALTEKVAEAVEGGVNVVQLREKDLPDEKLLPLAQALREVTSGKALLIINGPAEIAQAVQADGVHLPEAAPPAQEARRLLAKGSIVGRSAHSVAGARRAQEEGADYVQLGSVFPTRSHPGVPPAGLALIEDAAKAVDIPIVAVGGITAENIGSVLAAGAKGCAVISAILGSERPRETAQRLRGAIMEWEAKRK
ncbi:MAG TPA: thiamine phosphate synthase [Dehalococcoidia bacterium]|nr:thiamine phosphate synthase [Dehalococcoidia bacterium]